MRYLALLTLSLLFILPAAGQNVRVLTDDDWCDDQGWGNRDTERYCQVREFTLEPRDLIDVDGMQNGGVHVEGWDRDEILVRARVTANARTESQARELAEAVSIDVGRRIKADLPSNGNGGNGRNKRWTSVSYQIYAPRHSNVDLTTHNGGIQIENIDGDVEFDVLNGGVRLIDLAGNIEGSTTNGGVEVELTGSEWEGDGMDVTTTNGGVKLLIPDNYSAQLETGTVNGKLEFDFPVTIKGRLDRKISTTLGDGGKTIRVRTTNGGVKVQRS